MELPALISQNPWWSNLEALKEDYHLRLFDEAPIKWRPGLLSQFNLETDGVYVLRGPRQVGKTTLIKLLLKELLLKDKRQPKTVFYFACDEGGIGGDQELKDLLQTYISWVRSDLPQQRLSIFLDEATYAKNWATGVKVVGDRGMLQRVTVIATGSHSIDLKLGGERMPGRRGTGAGLDKVMLPMNFREFVETVEPELSQKLPESPGLRRDALHHTALTLVTYDQELTDLFQKYLLVGGFPRAVSVGVSRGEIPKGVYEIYRQAIAGDLSKLRRREDYFRQLALRVFEKLTNPFDWRDMARETDIGSHNTVSQYMRELELSFVWNIIYHAKTLGDRTPAFRKRKKVYFNDPFIFHTLRAWVYGLPDPWSASQDYILEPERRGKLVELVVASHLKSRFDEVFYWRKKESDEIDFVLREDGLKERFTYIEAKYRTRVSPDDAKRLKKSGGGILLTRENLSLSSDGKVLALPVPYFLAML